MCSSDLQREFAAKLACAERAGLEAFAVSQFCFDGSTLAAWLSGFRAQGYTLPVKVGIAGPASLRKLMALGLR